MQCAVYGNFSAPKAQEIIVSRGNVLELLRPDDSGRLQTVFSTDVFGCIRALAPFRLTGATRDYLIVGSDSGRLVICEYLKEKNTFKKVHQETFGKSGCRRIVPGQFLAVDPKGRACLTGAGPWQHRGCLVECGPHATCSDCSKVYCLSCAVHVQPSGSTCSKLCLQRASLPGCQLRRSPGQRRGFCAAAVEKQKLVYVLNRDAAANLTISSPLEAHKSHNIVFSVTGMDMGFDNPVFAAIELDYAEADQVCCHIL